MQRRSVVLAGLVLLFVVAGVLWYQTGSCSTDVHMGIESQYTKQNVLSETSESDLRLIDSNEERHVVITKASEARYYLENGSAREAFALETEFSDSYVLVIQTVDSSTPRLEPRCLQRDDDIHVVEAALTHVSGPRTSDLRTHSLVLRMPRERGVSPANVTVRVTGHEVKPVYLRW